MKTKIKAITIIRNQDIGPYEIGKYYNGLLLDHIDDRSQEFHDSIEFIYQGFTKDNDLVFEVINAPIDVEYIEDKQ